MAHIISRMGSGFVQSPIEDIFSLDKLLPMAAMAFIYWTCRREVKNRDPEIAKLKTKEEAFNE